MMIEELPEEKLPFLNFPNDGIASAVASAAATLSAGLSGGGGDRPAGERSRAPAGVLSFPALMHRVACEESVRSQAITWSADGHAMYLHAEHPALPGVLQTHWNRKFFFFFFGRSLASFFVWSAAAKMRFGLQFNEQYLSKNCFPFSHTQTPTTNRCIDNSTFTVG